MPPILAAPPVFTAVEGFAVDVAAAAALTAAPEDDELALRGVAGEVGADVVVLPETEAW